MATRWTLVAAIMALSACSGAEPVEEAEKLVPTSDYSPPDPNENLVSEPLFSRAITAEAPAARVPATRTTCRNIIGSLMDPAPEGRNVRSGPSVNAAQIATLPPPLRAEEVPAWDRPLAVSFDIIGSQNGWLLIRNASYDEQLADQPVPTVFSGEGWISGRGVYVGLQTRAAFSEPSHDAAVLIGGESIHGIDGWDQHGIAACQDQWVLVDLAAPAPAQPGEQLSEWADAAIISRDPFTLRAWAAGVCNIIETSCDGVDGTTPENAFRE